MPDFRQLKTQGFSDRDVVEVVNTSVRRLNAIVPNEYAVTVATLPDATVSGGGLIYVTDEAGGPVLAFSNGTNWIRVTDGAVVT